MQFKTLLVFSFCFIYFTTQSQNNKIPENKISNLGYSNTFTWNPSDKKYGIDAEIQFSLNYYAFEDKVLVAQNVKIEKGNTIYHEGKTYTKQEVGEKAYNQIRVQEVDFKVTLTDGKRSVVVFFMDVMPQEEDHVRQFHWSVVFYGDYHEDRKPLDHSTVEKFDASVNENKKMIYSHNFRVSNVQLLDVKSYNIPDDRATKHNQNKKEREITSKKNDTKSTNNLDDLLEESGKANSTNKGSSNSLDDLLSDSTENEKSTSNSLDDLLSPISDSKSSGNDLDDLLGSSKDDSDFTIDTKDGLTGVVNSNGRILIPYKQWSIIEYKNGIAAVRYYLDESYSDDQCSFYAHKEGFVDASGEFLDGFNIGGEFQTRGLRSTLFLMRDDGRSREELDAASARIKKNIRKENAVKSKKCESQYNSWLSGIKSRYR